MFGSELVDTTGSYDPTTSIYTAPFPGNYRFRARITHDATIVVGSAWTVKIKTPAREFNMIYAPVQANLATVIIESGPMSMAAGETARVTIARFAGTGNFVTVADGNLTEFSGEMVQ